MPKFSLKFLASLVGGLAVCFAFNAWPRMLQWEKGERYRVVAYGFPLEFYSRCEVTYPASRTLSGQAETELNSESHSDTKVVLNVLSCLLLSTLLAVLLVMVFKRLNLAQVMVFSLSCSAMLVLNRWEQLTVQQTSLLESRAAYSVGFPFRYQYKTLEQSQERVANRIAAGWPHSEKYFRKVANPQLLRYNLMIGLVGSIMLSSAFIRPDAEPSDVRQPV